MRFFVYPYRQKSSGAKALARALGGKVLKRENSSYVPRQGDIIINWGDGSGTAPSNCLNRPVAVSLVSNKRSAFGVFKDKAVSIPKFATTAGAVDWEGTTVVRHKLTGHSGEGIELVEHGQTLPDAPLYVEYIKKEQEYRIHVGKRGEESIIIAAQRKARRRDTPDDKVNWQVRNHDNGFVFVREGVNPPPSVTEAAIDALRASGLDFGAVDVIYNEKQRKAYVLEINTAPGLEGQTITDYAAFFKG